MIFDLTADLAAERLPQGLGDPHVLAGQVLDLPRVLLQIEQADSATGVLHDQLVRPAHHGFRRPEPLNVHEDGARVVVAAGCQQAPALEGRMRG